MLDLIRSTVELLLGTTVQSLQPGNELLNLVNAKSSPVVMFSGASHPTDDLKALGYEHFRSFIVIPGRGVPRWVLPVAAPEAITAATEIYQPHKVAPRIGKWVATELLRRNKGSWLGLPLRLSSATELPLESLVREVTGERQPLFTLSFGRRPAVRKLTAQVLRPSGEILGYMKLPLTGTATERVMNEARTLASLAQFPSLRPHVPRLLHAGKWSNSYLLFQSPLQGEPGPTAISTLHETFFEKLWAVHRVERNGQSLVDSVAKRWQHAVGLLNTEWSALGDEALRRAAESLDGKMVECGLNHGDFAPWNTRTADGRLLVFDWESADWNAPLLWDMFHFGLQTAASSLRTKEHGSPFTASGRGTYLLYLLISVVQFLEEKNPEAIEHRRCALLKELHTPPALGQEKSASSVQVVEVRAVRRGDRRTNTPQTRLIPRIVTTSWDDGDPRDNKIADLLKSRGLAGTFYIPMSGYLKRPTLTGADIQALVAANFEVGAHSVSHESLTRLRSGREIRREVSVCKDALEQITGKEVAMFCYPNGRYDDTIIREVQHAGYRGARTTRMLSVATTFNPFEMPTTLQAYPHGSSGYIKDLGRARSASGLWRFTTELSDFQNWLDIGRRLFSRVMERGGIWHLYGHSWEIDEHDLWPDLVEMLDHVSHREGVLYLTNSHALSLIAQ